MTAKYFEMLNEGQRIALFNMVDHVINRRSNRCLVVRAAGGTGKTFVAKLLMQILEESNIGSIAVSFTGKAAGQLSRSGIRAITCHSLLYRAVLDDDGNLVTFVKKDHSEIMATAGSAIICDEGSMIPKDMHYELTRIGVPVIYLGDFDQLPPVQQERGTNEFNVMTSLTNTPYLSLTKIERFGDDTGIGKVCAELRQENTIRRRKMDDFSVIPKRLLDDVEFHKENQFDIVLCGINKTRKRFNNIIRAARGYTTNYPQVGEQIICLRNDVVGEVSISNGEMFIVTSVVPYERFIKMTLQSMDFDGKNVAVKTLEESWTTEESPSRIAGEPVQLFTFGYCISVHKSQGSTVENVLFYDEDVSFFLDQRRFRYTACSRASKKLTVAM